MSILHFCQWLENTPVGVAVRQSVWLFPIVETTHTVGIALMAGTIAIVDLRRQERLIDEPHETGRVANPGDGSDGGSGFVHGSQGPC